MKNAAAAIAFLLPLSAAAQTDAQWALETSTLTYRVSHPLHDTEGVSHAARGKAACRAGQCDVLIAAPVKSFASGDSNRDLHMLQATRGAEFPLVSVRLRLPESAADSATIDCDLEIEFAGQTARYKAVPFRQVTEGSTRRVSGTVPAKLSDFRIPPPSLLAVPVKDDMPVSVEMTWHPM
jgi:hypothetical protein